MDYKQIDEIFPLVDDQGAIIGQATRRECHSGSKLLHPVIHLHIFNSKGELFLQKRSVNKDIQPNKWDSSVGGHINIDETPILAAKREAEEEIGLFLSHLYYIDKFIIETDIERELTYVFYTECDMQPRIDMDEVSDGKYWTIKAVKQQIGKDLFTPNFELDFHRYLQYGISFLKEHYNNTI